MDRILSVSSVQATLSSCHKWRIHIVVEFAFAVTDVTVDNAGYDQIIGFLGTTIETIPFGDYFGRIIISTDTLTFNILHEAPPPSNHQVFIGFFGSDEPGFAHVNIHGALLPLDLSQITISDATGFSITLTLADFTVETDPTAPNSVIIEGRYPVDFTTLAAGNYTVVLTSGAAGVLTFSDVPFDVETGTGGTDGYFIERFAIFESNQVTEFVMAGDNFESIDQTQFELILANDAAFAGTTYPVTGLTFEFNDRVPDEIHGIVNAPASTFISGQTFLKIIDRGSENVNIVFFSESPSGIEVHDIQIEQSGDRTDRSKIDIFGFGFFGVPIVNIQISNDATFATNVHNIVNVAVESEGNIRGFIEADAFSFAPGTYYLRFLTPEGEFIIDVIFEGPEVKLLGITMVAGANASETTLQVTGKGLTTVNFDSLIISVSQDPAFAAGSDIYVAENIVVTTNPDGTDQASGTMTVDFASLAAGSYFMRVVDLDPEEETELFPFFFGTATSTGLVEDIAVFPSAAGGMEVNMIIKDFVTTDIVSFELSNDLTFTRSDSVFLVLNPVFTPDPLGFEIVNARIDAPFSRILDADYYVRVTLTDNSQLLFGPFRFGVGTVDLPPPVFFEFPRVIDGDSVSVTIGWVTDKPATSEVEYNTAVDFNGNNFVESDPTLTDVHIVEITGLTPRTDYIYFVKSTDENNQSLFSPKLNFNTNVVTDDEPPVIFDIPRVFGVTRTSATIGWLTNERSTSLVEYNTQTQWDLGIRLTAEVAGLVREHRVPLADLIPGETYVLRVSSTDRFDNEPAVSPERTFTTLLVADEESPLILGFPFGQPLDITVVEIIWQTNEAADSRVEYYERGDNTGVRVKEDDADVFDHSIIISGLTPGLTYEARVSSTDPSDNGTRSELFSWTMPLTLSSEPPFFVVQPEARSTDLGKVTVRWESNTPSNTIISYNTEELYNQEIFLFFEDPAFVLEHRAVFEGLLPNTNYKLQAQMWDSRGIGSALSQVIEFRTSGTADDAAPALRGFPGIVESSPTTVVLGWLTDEPSTSIVSFAPTDGFPAGLVRFEDPAPVLDVRHFVFLSGLTPGTAYTYTLESADAAGNTATFEGPAGQPYTFTTRGSDDNEPPIIWGFPRVVGVDTSKATVEWITNEFSTSIVQYNTPEALAAGDTLVAEKFNFVDFHSVTLTGLTKNTPYFYRVGSTDRNNNGPTFSPVQEFRTAGESDNTPPFIKGFPGVNVVDPTSAIFFWETDEASNSVVNYRPLDETGVGIGDFLFVPDQVLTRFHTVFVPGLTPGTNYEFFVSSADANNNGTSSGISTFTTRTDADADAPRFFAWPSVEVFSTTEARVFFETDEPATTTIEYNETSLFDVGIFLVFDDLNLLPLHDVVLSGLTAGTRYKLRISTTDGQNNGPTVSRTLEFATSNVEDNQPPGFTSVPQPVVRDTNLVVIGWSTDEIATSAVIYARAEDYDTENLRRRAEGGAEGTDHLVTVTGLEKNKSYRYQIESKDSRGNVRVGTCVFDFKTTNVVDTRAPVIEIGPTPLERGPDRVVIAWKTDEPGKSIVEIALEADFPTETLRRRVERSDLADGHFVEIDKLTANTQYFYRVGSIDSRNNGPDWSDVRDVSTTAVEDNTPPVIRGNPDFRPVDETSMVINWFTNKQANSRVDFWPNSDPSAVDH